MSARSGSRRKIRRLKLVEFFAGIGCAATGLGVGDDGQWEIALANDMSGFKAELHELHHPGAPMRVEDVSRLLAEHIPRADVWWASSPCTDVSLSGKKTGMKGPKSSLAWVITKRLRRAVAMRTQPSVVCFENVLGLLRFDIEGFCLLVRDLWECGYLVGAVVMEASCWLPADRERVFIVAVRRDRPVPDGLWAETPEAPWHSRELVRAHAALGADVREDWRWWRVPACPVSPVLLGDILEDVPEAAWDGEEKVVQFLEMLRPAHRAVIEEARLSGASLLGVMTEKTDPIQDGQPWTYRGRTCRRRRMSVFRADVAYTLLATATGSSRQKLVVVRNGRVCLRNFTPREIARLMGVSDGLAVPETPAKAMLAFGDAVAIPVVRHLGEHLLAPLAEAARGGAEPPRPPENWQRRIKSRTKGLLLYMLPEAHAAFVRAAAKEGLSLSKAAADAIDAWMVARGLEPLPRYEPEERPKPVTKRGPPRGA